MAVATRVDRTSTKSGSSMMDRIAAAVISKPRAIVFMGVAFLICFAPFAAQQNRRLSSGDFSPRGSQSYYVDHEIAQFFPDESRSSMGFLFWPSRRATGDDIRRAIAHAEHALSGLGHIKVTKRVLQIASFGADLREPLVMPLNVTTNEEGAQRIAEVIRKRLKLDTPNHHDETVQTHLLGEPALWAGLQDTYNQNLTRAEKIGLPILLAALLLMFGSVWAAALPLALCAVTLTVTGGLIYFVSYMFQLDDFVTNTASMLGIGVAVDYALIIVARVRQELRVDPDIETAVRTAILTSGRAVVISGVAVVAALSGLMIVPNGTLRSMMLGGILVVTVSFMMSVTFLPALALWLGPRRISAGLPRIISGRLRASDGSRQTWQRWAQRVVRRPLFFAIVAAAFLIVLCIPVTSVRTNSGALAQFSPANETRVGVEEAEKLEGPGVLAPINVLALFPPSMSPAQRVSLADSWRASAQTLAGIKKVEPLRFAAQRRAALMSVIENETPESSKAKQVVDRLRALIVPKARKEGVVAAVGGTTAVQIDEEKAITASMPRVVGLILIVTFVMLMLLLRSIWLPLKAIVMNVLSVGAGYGVMVAVFQWGWLDSVTGYRSLGHLETLTPPLILAIVFGLSMDYEIFLLTRVREAWQATGNAQTAVVQGLSESAKTISSAAFVLVIVFAIFIATGAVTIKEIGVGAGVAIGLDATVIRLLLVPSIMSLLGARSWWWPRALSRRTSNVSVRPVE